MAESGAFAAVERRTLVDHVYEQLRGAILRGELPEGSDLKQLELAKQLGVSRVPIREALRRLQAERLVVANPFQRYTVTKVTLEELMELTDLRAELETFALKQRLRRTDDPVDLAAATRAMNRLVIDSSPEEWLAADRAFHHLLNGKTVTAVLIDEIRERIHSYLTPAASSEDRRREVLAEHAELLDAIGRGAEDEVENIIRAHVEGTRRVLKEWAIARSEGPA